MVLRVYAMWNRSKTVLGILLCLYVTQTITAFTFAGIYNTPGPYFSGMFQAELQVSFHL